MLRYRFSKQRQEKMDPPEVAGVPCHFTTVNKSWREVSFSPMRRRKQRRAKGKRLRKRARALRQTKGDIKKKKKRTKRSKRKISIHVIRVFHRCHSENTNALCCERFTWPPRVCVRGATENIFDFIYNGRSLPSRKKYRFFICVSDKSDFSIDNKSCVRTFKCAAVCARIAHFESMNSKLVCFHLSVHVYVLNYSFSSNRQFLLSGNAIEHPSWFSRVIMMSRLETRAVFQSLISKARINSSYHDWMRSR